MRILFVVPYPPSLIRVRPYNLIKALSGRGHEVIVATLWTTEEERAAAESLRRHCHRVIAVHLPRWRPLVNCVTALPTATPLQAVYCWHPRLAEEVATMQPDVDIVHVEHLRGAPYALRAAQQNGATVVWDSVDCISHLFAQAAENSRSLKGRLMTRLELSRTRAYEAWLVRQFDRVLVTSPIDKQALEALIQDETKNGKLPTRSLDLNLSLNLDLDVLPNGVDLDYFAPTDTPREPATLVFSGKMSYHANVTAALYLINDIMPHVWSRRPETHVWIVGKNPTREVQALTRTNGYGHVHVTGTVPDIRPYLTRATIAVAPMPYGAGIQNKVLEAMASGTPTVTSMQAISALEAHVGRDLLAGDTPDTIARAVLGLLDTPGQRRAIGHAGRTYVETYHSWNAVAARLETIYQQARDVRYRALRG